MKSVYITHAKRTAIGTLLGDLGAIPASILGSLVIKSILKNSKLDPKLIDEVIMGQVLTSGVGQNPARQASIAAGLPETTTAFTINKVCGSGLKALALAANSIISGDSNIVVAGGQENMSLAMHAAYLRSGKKFGNVSMIDLMQYDGLTDVFSGNAMGITAENIASKFNITREMQDDFAFAFHKKATIAAKESRFSNEILPVEVKIKKEILNFAKDQGIRHDISREALSKLLAAFDKSGTVTAGNASSINDGAACLMLASEESMKKNQLKPLVRIVPYASAGVNPDIMGIGPVPASMKALSRAGWRVEDLDVIEANEAFAAQAIYVNQQMKWDLSKVNMNGGAIALGHPIGASGARVLVTLIHQMMRINGKRGLATLCIGGGMGIAMCVELC